MEKRINLLPYRGNGSTYFTGRPQGEDVRKELKLDSEDFNSEKVVFLIPEGTTSFNPSFYLGLLYNSFKKLGPDKFRDKYSFEILDENEAIKRVIQDNLDDAIRSASMAYNNKGGFPRFT